MSWARPTWRLRRLFESLFGAAEAATRDASSARAEHSPNWVRASGAAVSGASGPSIRIVLDTNQWVTSLLLRSATGAALVHMIARSGGRLVVPDAIEGEIEEVIRRRAEEAIRL